MRHESSPWKEDLIMKRRFTEEQIIAVLREHRWKSKYGGLEVSDMRRLKELEAENAKLKKLLAEAHLDNGA
jgi:putative transposase